MSVSQLSAFFADNKIKQENIFYVASDRFVDPKTKEPMKWEIRAIDSEINDKIQSECMKLIPVPGKRNSYTTEIDTLKYAGLMCVACTVFPNLNDKELQDSYKVMGAVQLLRKMLSPGEYAEYSAKVLEINGFNKSRNDLVEEAKN
jgi:hypothetical protein